MPTVAVAMMSALLAAQGAPAPAMPIERVAAPCHIMVDGVCKVAVAQTAPTQARAGNGGNGGAVKMGPSGAGSPAAASPPPGVPVSLTLRKCTLTIAGTPVVDATGCRYNQLGQQFTLVAPSENQKHVYTIKVAWDDQKIGTATLEGGRTNKVRDLSPMTRKGACWVKTDGTVEICAWK